MKEILRLEHIRKYYGNKGNITKAINDISFSVNAGEFVGIMGGASGSGKTTLLNCIFTIDTVSGAYLSGRNRRDGNQGEGAGLFPQGKPWICLSGFQFVRHADHF